MRPNAVESLRGLQAALVDTIAPELSTMYAQDAANILQMLIESVAGEWDSAADDLARDNRRLGELLSQAREAFSSNAGDGALVKEIEAALAAPAGDSLRLSDLAARNNALRGALERVLLRLEDAAGGPEGGATAGLRKAIYDHLREVCLRGWSLWDLMSFREKMAAARSGPAA